MNSEETELTQDELGRQKTKEARERFRNAKLIERENPERVRGIGID